MTRDWDEYADYIEEDVIASMLCVCKPGGIMPKINGKSFSCNVCYPNRSNQVSDVLVTVFSWSHDDRYGCLLVCNGCGTEYTSE